MVSVARRQKIAIGLLLLCTVLWSLSGVGLKGLFATTRLTPTAIGGYRALYAGLSLLPLAFFSGGLQPRRLRPVFWVALAAASFCTMTWTFVASTGRTTSANAIVLMYTAPLWVLLLAPWITKDHAQRRDLWAAALGMGGMAVIVFGPLLSEQQPSRGETAGLVLALASGLTLAILTMALRRLKQADPVAITCLNNLLTGAVLLATEAFQGNLYCSWRTTLVLAALGAFQIGTPYALYCYCLRFLAPQRATLIMLAEPIMNPIWVWMVIGEIPAGSTLLGGAVILGGLVVMISGRQHVSDRWGDQPGPGMTICRKDVSTAA